MVFMKAKLLQVKIPVFISHHFGGGSFFSISVSRGCKQDSSGEGAAFVLDQLQKLRGSSKYTHLSY